MKPKRNQLYSVVGDLRLDEIVKIQYVLMRFYSMQFCCLLMVVLNEKFE